MAFEEEAFPAARRAHWPCATQVDRMTKQTSVTSVCYFQVPAAPTLGGRRVVVQGAFGVGGRRSGGGRRP